MLKTPQVINQPGLGLKEIGSPLGRGVFTENRVTTGEIVEVAPVVLIALNTQPFPAQIRRLVYNWSKTHVALALGYGSLYNHSDQPNLAFKKNTDNQTITFSALQEIKSGEQLTISYDYTGPGPNPREKSWFEIHKVEKIEIEAKPRSNRSGDALRRPLSQYKEKP